MRAEIDKRGVLHIIPENETEAYAIAQWRVESEILIQFSDPGALQMRGEQHWRADRLRLSANWPRQIGDRS